MRAEQLKAQGPSRTCDESKEEEEVSALFQAMRSAQFGAPGLCSAPAPLGAAPGRWGLLIVF